MRSTFKILFWATRT